jgi:hypothetical protein
MRGQHVLSLSLHLPKRRPPGPVESTGQLPCFDVHRPSSRRYGLEASGISC